MGCGKTRGNSRFAAALPKNARGPVQPMDAKSLRPAGQSFVLEGAATRLGSTETSTEKRAKHKIISSIGIDPIFADATTVHQSSVGFNEVIRASKDKSDNPDIVLDYGSPDREPLSMYVEALKK